MNIKPDRGFTSVELLIGVVIMGVVAALAAPRASTLMSMYRFANAAKLVWLDMHKARLMAIKQGTTMRVDFHGVSYDIVRIDTGQVVLSRNLSGATPRGEYPGITAFLNGANQSISFSSTGTADNRTVVIQGPTRRKSFTIITTGRIGHIS